MKVGRTPTGRAKNQRDCSISLFSHMLSLDEIERYYHRFLESSSMEKSEFVKTKELPRDDYRGRVATSGSVRYLRF